MKRFSLLVILLSSYLICQSQISSKPKTLTWSDTLRSLEFSDYKMHEVLYFKGAAYDEIQYGYLPYYFESVHLPKDGAAAVTLSDEVYAPIVLKKGSLPNNISATIGNAPKITIGQGYERKQAVADISILPFRKNETTGLVEKLVSFRYNVNVKPLETADVRDGDDYAAHSVLASGNWYKIALDKDGIYKIDKGFLDALGIPTSSIDPRNIRIYGNGGGMIPEANSSFRYDDLQENAIKIVGEDDGVFDAGDYILFYGQGPTRWTYDATAQKYFHVQHLYSKYTYYFITTDLGPGKRVSDQPSLSQTPNVFVSSFNDFAVHEIDLENFLDSGREWYGESFEFETSQSFPFNISNVITTSPVKITGSFASKSIYSSNSFSLSVNGQLLGSTSIPQVCGDYTCSFANTSKIEGQITGISGNFSVDLDYTRVSADAIGWLNYLEVNVERSLTWTGSQMNFRNGGAIAAGSFAQFDVGGINNSLLIWDVTHPTNVKNQLAALNGTQYQYIVAADSVHEFVLFSNAEGYQPLSIGKIVNQDLHGLAQAAFIIVSPEALISQANQLADFHRGLNGMTVNVASAEQVYNEFASGAPDIAAIRDFTRMFYERAGTDPNQLPKYILLFGDGSYDNKENIEGNGSLIPTYQSSNSLSPTSSYVSDDFFGMLDEDEGSNLLDPNAKIDIAIGRLPVNNIDEAASMINKIKIYGSPESFGNWRNVITFVADDEDSNVHLKDADEVAVSVGSLNPVYNIDKIYLDAYKQVAIPGGSRYPDVNLAINNRICAGTLLINYVGHGGVGGWAHERVLGNSDIQSYTNLYKLALWVTATCEFSKYDDPALVSAGELLLSNTQGGAIALVTTVRLVYSSANRLMNEAFMDNVFLAENGVIPPLGEVFRKGKNAIGGDTNNRKFTMLGDPALTLAYPTFNVNTTAINSNLVGTVTDTLSALEKVTIAGNVTDLNGNVMTDFNGTLYPTVFDKPVTYQTLKNDPSSQVKNFVLQKNVIYNGKASIKNGEFTFSFIVPKDISYQYGFGKLSYYAENGGVDAHGYKNDVMIGGVADSSAGDLAGPEVKVYMNDEKFVFGGITDESPAILVKLKDENGVNTVGTGIGHDITAILDNDSKNTLVMNEFYSADLDSYQSGEVMYPLNSLIEGHHSVSVKAWDVFNNSTEGYTEFVVSTSAEMALAHVLNYPNPFTTSTEFMFEHNMAGQDLHVMVQVFTISGRLIKTIREMIVPETMEASAAGCGLLGTEGGGYRVNGIYWDGRDDYGDRIGKGVYVYKVTVQAENGLKAEAFEKLVILK